MQHYLYSMAYSYSVLTTSSFQDGSPPLHSAVSGNQQEIVELLIEKYSADPTAAATMVSLICLLKKLFGRGK